MYCDLLFATPLDCAQYRVLRLKYLPTLCCWPAVDIEVQSCSGGELQKAFGAAPIVGHVGGTRATRRPKHHPGVDLVSKMTRQANSGLNPCCCTLLPKTIFLPHRHPRTRVHPTPRGDPTAGASRRACLFYEFMPRRSATSSVRCARASTAPAVITLSTSF